MKCGDDFQLGLAKPRQAARQVSKSPDGATVPSTNNRLAQQQTYGHARIPYGHRRSSSLWAQAGATNVGSAGASCVLATSQARGGL
jgi:hypothetical protein